MNNHAELRFEIVEQQIAGEKYFEVVINCEAEKHPDLISLGGRYDLGRRSTLYEAEQLVSYLKLQLLNSDVTKKVKSASR